MTDQERAEALIEGSLKENQGGVLADVLAAGAVTGNADDILPSTLAGPAPGVHDAPSNQPVSPTRPAGPDSTPSGRVLLASVGAVGGAGDMDGAVVLKQVQARIGAIRGCYERELRSDPRLAGKITVEFTLHERGNVTDAKVIDNATGSAPLASCVVDTVMRFRFNPGPEGGSVTYSYPFQFQPQ